MAHTSGRAIILLPVCGPDRMQRGAESGVGNEPFCNRAKQLSNEFALGLALFAFLKRDFTIFLHLPLQFPLDSFPRLVPSRFLVAIWASGGWSCLNERKNLLVP